MAQSDFMKNIEKKIVWERDLAALLIGVLPPFAQVTKEIGELLV